MCHTESFQMNGTFDGKHTCPKYILLSRYYIMLVSQYGTRRQIIVLFSFLTCGTSAGLRGPCCPTIKSSYFCCTLCFFYIVVSIKFWNSVVAAFPWDCSGSYVLLDHIWNTIFSRQRNLQVKFTCSKIVAKLKISYSGASLVNHL